jgi:hypothetical protein
MWFTLVYFGEKKTNRRRADSLLIYMYIKVVTQGVPLSSAKGGHTTTLFYFYFLKIMN